MQLQCNTLFFLILAETSEHSFANIFDLSETEKKKQTPKNKTQKTPKQNHPKTKPKRRPVWVIQTKDRQVVAQ